MAKRYKMRKDRLLSHMMVSRK